MAELSEATQALLAKMEAGRGFIYPTHRYLAEHAPAYLEAYNDLAAASLLHGREDEPHALHPKYRELIVAVILAHRQSGIPGIVSHLRRARALGATDGEMLEAFEAAMLPSGAPTLFAGISALLELDAEA